MAKTVQKVDNKSPTIGFIGAGNMAAAIITALNNRGYKSLLAYDIDTLKLDELKGLIKIAKSSQEVIQKSDYIFICLKPQIAKVALKDLNFASDKIVISILAGVTLKTLQNLTGVEKIVRVMPNMNAAVGQSVNAYCFSGLDKSQQQIVSNMLNSFGNSSIVQEEKIDSITGIAGSGPAFVFRFLKGLVMAAEKEGLEPTVAIEIATQMLNGSTNFATKKLEKLNKTADFKQILEELDTLTNSICSKGGTTIEGVNHLDNNNFSELVAGAVGKSCARAKELSSE